MPSPNVVGKSSTAINGAKGKLQILVKQLYNLGVSRLEITKTVREAYEEAAHDGVGQEA